MLVSLSIFDSNLKFTNNYRQSSVTLANGTGNAQALAASEMLYRGLTYLTVVRSP